jgi:ADP-ribose pyrophosphatase YjhB (NUDIX family)
VRYAWGVTPHTTPTDTLPAAYPLVTVGALALSPREQVLLVRTHKWRGLWGVPGGKLAYGETLAQALRREFREETGLTLTDLYWGPVQEAVKSPEFYREAHFVLLNFIARCTGDAVTLNEEAEAYVWVAPEAALSYELNTPTRSLVRFYLERRHALEALPCP